MLPAVNLGIRINDGSSVYLLPSLTAYIGADVIAGLCTLTPPGYIRNYLFLDIGTNGEMALVAHEKVYFCATAAGPAFEGANISCGIAGVEGAISSYSAEGYATIGDTAPIGICGSGLLDIIAFLLNENLIATDGYMENEFAVVPESHSSVGRPLILKPSDVRELQLAKAAIAAGINILLGEAGLSVIEIDALFLAGGFGNFLNIESALRIGLIPYELKNKIIPVGNTSGTGALLALKSEMFNQLIDQLVKKAHYIELSRIESFTDEFALNMGFPA